jgi:hypothetical protein
MPYGKNRLVEQVDTLRHLKAVAAQASTDAKDAQDDLIKMMQTDGVTSFDADLPDATVKATIVEGSTIVLDEAKLKKKLGAPVWKKLLKWSLDRQLLEDAIARGTVSATTVAECSEEKPRAAFVKLTEHTKAKKTNQQRRIVRKSK